MLKKNKLYLDNEYKYECEHKINYLNNEVENEDFKDENKSFVEYKEKNDVAIKFVKIKDDTSNSNTDIFRKVSSNAYSGSPIPANSRLNEVQEGNEEPGNNEEPTAPNESDNG